MHAVDLLKKGLFAFAIGFVLGMSSCTTLQLDRSVSAADGNAKTIYLGVPGSDPQRGYVMMEVRETAQPTAQITMYAPQAACKRAACVEYQIIGLDGSFGKSGSLAAGQASIAWPLSDITGDTNQITKSVDGEYQIVVRVYFTGPDGFEYQSIMKGFVRVVVLTADYKPMGCNDPNVAWESKPFGKKGCRLQWSSVLRSAKCGKCSVSTT